MFATLWKYPFRSAYAAIALLTFGHVASAHPCYKTTPAPCHAGVKEGVECYRVRTDAVQGPATAFKSLVIAAGWPLYISWHIQSGGD